MTEWRVKKEWREKADITNRGLALICLCYLVVGVIIGAWLW